MQRHHISAGIASLFLCSSIGALLLVTLAKAETPNVFLTASALSPSSYTPIDSVTTAPKVQQPSRLFPSFTTHPPEVLSEVTTNDPQPAPQSTVPETIVDTPPSAKDPITPTPPDTTTTFKDAVVANIHTLTNKRRAREGLAPLTLSTELTTTAKAKANDMITQSYFAHSNPQGCDFTCILKQHNFKAYAWGENLMQYTSSKTPSATTLASATFDSWIASSGHAENILHSHYTHEGIALVEHSGTFYIVSHFAQIE